MEQEDISEQEEMLEGDGTDCQPLHLQLQEWLRYSLLAPAVAKV